MVLGVMLVAVVSGAGCEKDADCKGDRICESGRCVSPPAALLPPPPASPPPLVPAPLAQPEGPRRPLGGPATSQPPPSSDPCAEPLDVDGRLKPECRVTADQQPPLRSKKGRRAAPGAPLEEPAARAVGMMGVMYGILIAGGAVAPVFAFAGAAGVRLRSGVGFVGVLHGRIAVNQNSSIQIYGLGPGIRFGDRSQLTLAITPSFTAISVGSFRQSGFLFTILAQGAVVIGKHFTLFAQPTIDFDGSGAVGAITAGLGVTF